MKIYDQESDLKVAIGKNKVCSTLISPLKITENKLDKLANILYTGIKMKGENKMTITSAQFNSGKGKMSYDRFAQYADQMGINQAVWVAKYFGIALNVVKSFVRLYLTK